MATVQGLEDKEPASQDFKSSKGPPAASPKPRSAADSSLYSTVGQAGTTDGMAGLGSEGNSPALIGMQGLALVQRGLQMLNLAFPENPGLVAVLSDITGRLQTLVPQLVAQSANSMGGGMMGMAMQQQQPGMGPMGALPMGAAPGLPMPPSAGAPLPPGVRPPVPPPV